MVNSGFDDFGNTVNSEYTWYVKPELITEFEKFCKRNCYSYYDSMILSGVHMICWRLMSHSRPISYFGSTPATPEEAHDWCMNSIIGYSALQVSVIYSLVRHFSPRGEEFWEWKNKE